MARHPQLARFLELVDLPLTTTNQTHAMLSTAIARHLIFALAHALHTHPDAQFVIVLEEDVQVSPDFFVYVKSAYFFTGLIKLDSFDGTLLSSLQ